MIKLKSLINEKFEDWDSGYWVHYSDVDYIKVKPDRTPGDIFGPAAIFLFPFKFEVKDREFLRKKYKSIVRLKPGIKTFDLGSVTPEIMLKISELFGIGKDTGQYFLKNFQEYSIPENFWSMLKRGLKREEFGKKFKLIGYDAVFDDVGAIYFTKEIQLLVFDEKNIEIVKTEINNKEK